MRRERAGRLWGDTEEGDRGQRRGFWKAAGPEEPASVFLSRGKGPERVHSLLEVTRSVLLTPQLEFLWARNRFEIKKTKQNT